MDLPAQGRSLPFSSNPVPTRVYIILLSWYTVAFLIRSLYVLVQGPKTQQRERGAS